MNVVQTALPGVVILEPKVFGDARGFFLETYRENTYREAGIPQRFVQANHSRSRRGVLRGLHYQLVQPQGKLVSVARGQVFDVAVDVRRGSPTFGQWVSCLLDDETHRQMYIPPGFAHGFAVVSEVADFLYQCTDYYHPNSEAGIAWNDPDLAITWPELDTVLSEKDLNNPRLKDQSEDRLPVYGGTSVLVRAPERS
ncbi:MAG TPA: dTDP-4-dehydrorhamnose 3,5-epimerase [Oscillatoriaceae cyanobacterium]